jgi:formiminotetrahydrofolate cyclodeaminase
MHELSRPSVAVELPRQSPAGGGALAAGAASLAAALVANLARDSQAAWSEAAGAAAQARTLEKRLDRLSASAAEVYRTALDSLSGTGDAPIAEALERAAEVPLAIAASSSDLALLAAETATAGDPAGAPDAACAAVVAEAAARSATHLVRVNLATRADDPRLARAEAHVGEASRAARRALEAVS